jgi:hypothetical protein
MTTATITVVSPAGVAVTLPQSSSATSSRHDPVPPIFRFSLRHLFWFVSAASILLAILASLPAGSYGFIALPLAISVIILHLLSTAVGNRLRAEADRQTGVFRPIDGKGLAPAETTQAALCVAASRSPLHARGLSIRWLPLLIVCGALLGGCIGAVLLELAIGSRTTPVGVAVGALSSAVLGGWLAFLGGSFFAIIRQGWLDAVAEPKTN